MAALLETRQPLTAAEIQRRVPGYPAERSAFRRSFERDKDDLRDMGIPLRVEKANHEAMSVDAYRIPPEDYILRDPGLEADELAALQLASRVVRVVGEGEDGTEDEALWKLGGVTQPAASTARGQKDEPSAPLAELPVDPRLTLLFAALVDRHTIQFGYQGEQRTVDPHRLDFERGRWYLSGWDHRRADRRSFRLDRIDAIVEVDTSSSFPPPPPASPVQFDTWRMGAEDPFIAELLVDPEQAAWATRHLGEDAIVRRQADGGVVFAVEVANLAAFRSFVLTFLDHAELLGPPHARADMMQWLRSFEPAGS